MPPAATGSGSSTGCPRRPARRRRAGLWSTPCSSGCSTCRRRSARRQRPPRSSLPSGRGWSSRSRSWPACWIGADGAADAWYAEAQGLVDKWFTLEDPTCLEPAERELYIEADLDGLTLRGYVDRLDVAPDGAVRIVDYKTGRSPSELFERASLFQMRFYALVLWRLRGVVPRMLQLVYLGDGEVIRYQPDEADLLATERNIKALWSAIQRAADTGDWRPRTSRLCDWCDHRDLCPAWGGTPPPLPQDSADRALDPLVTGAGAARRRLRSPLPPRTSAVAARPQADCAVSCTTSSRSAALNPRNVGSCTEPRMPRHRLDARHDDRRHTRRDGRAHARFGVLDRDAVERVHAERSRRRQVRVRKGLAPRHLVAGNHDVEERLRQGRLEQVGEPPVGHGHQRARYAGRPHVGQQLQRSRAPRDAQPQPCADPVDQPVDDLARGSG